MWTTYWPNKGENVDHLLTLQHIYIYIYICCRVKTWSKCCLFWVKPGPSIFLSFFINLLFSAGRMRCWIKRKKTTITICWVKTWSDYVAQLLRGMLGPRFDSTLDQVLTQPFWNVWAIFLLLRNIPKPLFLKGLQQNMHVFAHPNQIGTLCVNTIALTDKMSLFQHLIVFCFFLLCPVLFWSFLRGMKNKTSKQNKKGNKTTRCKQETT